MSALTVVNLPPSRADIDLFDFRLLVNERKLRSAQLANKITDATIERTMDGASTLTVTVHDPRRDLLNTPVVRAAFDVAIDAVLDTYKWRLVQLSKQDTDLTFTFEDLAVAQLRAKTGTKSISRSKVTRAEFALSLVREVKPPIPFVCPQLHRQQPIEAVKPEKGQTKADSRKLRKQLPYQFKRGGTDGEVENSWDCLTRLAQEVQWRCFTDRGALYFVSDTDLLRSAPSVIVTDASPALVGVDFDIDSGKENNEASVTARASRWGAGPGDVVTLDGYGPADGDWLVQSTTRNIYDANVDITLRRPAKPLPEPAAEQADIGGGAPAGISGDVSRVYEAAAAIDKKRFPYVYGGGHGACGIPSGSPPGFDCSGSVCAVLSAAQMGFTPGGGVSVAEAFASWGQPGEGSQMTVWWRGGGRSTAHVFIVFHSKSGDQCFTTGHWGKSWDGPGFTPEMHPTANFSPRHWPGT